MKRCRIVFDILGHQYKDGSFDSIVYRFAIRLSRLIADKFIDRQNLFKEVMSFYNSRSGIVYGNDKDREKYLKEANITKIES